MNTITNMFQQAQLAEAAYANFFNSAGNLATDIDSVKAALQNQGNGMSFSQAQAAAFVTHWKVIDHLADTGSGFSATLFESIDNPGVYSYAIRGTAQPLQDLLLADGQGIVRNGLAINQIVDMYNHWQRIQAPAGSTYQAAQLITLLDKSQGELTKQQYRRGLHELRASNECGGAGTGSETGGGCIVKNLASHTVGTVNHLYGESNRRAA